MDIISIKGTENNLTKLIPHKLMVKGPRELGQYLIEGWTMKGRFDADTDRKIILIELGD